MRRGNDIAEDELIAQADLAQSTPEIHEHLERVLASTAFRGSRRSQDFLRHVVDLTLKGEVDRLKERILGIEIFHRDNEYDTSEDAIVRVSANDVRRRLLLFYAEQPHEKLRIRLQTGSYVPDFRRSRPTVADDDKHAKTAIDLTASPAANQPIGTGTSEPAPAAMLPAKQHAWRTWGLLSGMAALALLSFSAGWFLRIRSATPISEIATSREYSFYKEMLGPIVTDPHMATDIIVSNPKIYLYRGSTVPNPDDGVDVGYPLPPNMAKELEVGANDIQASFPYHRLVLDVSDYTGMGEAKAMFGLGQVLNALGRTAHLSEARFLNWDVAQSEHLIVLGAPHMSAWTQSTLAGSNFIIDHDQIRNTHPLAGEQPAYESTGTSDDYALIGMSQSPSGARILLIAGVTSTGTAGAGIFFSSPASMRPIFDEMKKQAGNGPFPANWQVLLRVTERDRIPIKIVPIATRCDTRTKPAPQSAAR